MPVTIVLGGQYGSEGKGKVALAMSKGCSAVVRVGGPNAGHTVIRDGKLFVYRQLPVTNGLLPSIICAGSYIDPDILRGENPESLYIDPYAVVIQPCHKEQEVSLRHSIGSTGTGTGYALISRILRNKHIIFAKDHPYLKNFICDTKRFMRNLLDKGERILIEGSQGFGLSLLHSNHHPYVTSRDTSAAGILSEVGLSPLDVDEVVMVIRAYPIRVSGDSGPLPNETTWSMLGIQEEYTTVTRNVRRVGLWHPEVVQRAVAVNKPTCIVMNHMDYMSPDRRELFLCKVEEEIGQSVDYIGLDKERIYGTN